ncbi:MAG: hypothetical protein CYG59_16965 [Chloroflexi bacterium]|nr:MAG: hypothetical protein CYG59_16965 [Chloroflexota bacterium]
MVFPSTPAAVLLLLLLVSTALLVLVFALRVRSGRLPVFRPLPGITRLRTLFGEVAESGQPLHVATGPNQGSIAQVTPTAETLGSLLIAQRIAQETTKRGGTVMATSGDIVAHAALRGTFHQAYRQAGFASDFRPENVQLVAQNTPAAYAAGVAARYRVAPPAASVAAGSYGTEALLITEEGAAHGIPQVAAATSLAALPVLALSAEATLIGEELFAAEAYLSDSAAPKARLLTQDVLRWLVIALLLGGLLWQVLAPVLNLPELS